MRITLSSRVVALTAGVAIAVGAQALLPQAATAAAPSATVASAAVTHGSHRLHRLPSAVNKHPAHGSAAAHRSAGKAVGGGRVTAARATAWVTGNTAGRGLRLLYGGAVAAAIGKIFFTLGGTDYVCSGALVRSRHAYVVLTAAHCVRNGRGQWATDWTFVPGYKDGAQPYGQYTARRFFVSPRWTGPDTGSERYDVAFVQVVRATPDGERSRAAGAPAGLPIRFAASQTAAQPIRAYLFGYPALPPYTGLYANYCAGRAARTSTRPGSVQTACGMTAGDSGGPWLTGFSPRAETGTITAVTAFKLSGDLRLLYGTVLGPAARALYLKASA